MRKITIGAAAVVIAAIAISGCESSSLSPGNQKACGEVSGIQQESAQSDALLSDAVADATSGSVIQFESGRVLGDLRANDPNFLNDLHYLQALCGDGINS
jgi:outer membrane murein-binding lipoprotein Lpp